jgi:hypothetical protein
MGFLRYFFTMQCPECGYICFKQAKDCGGCGFNFKKAKTSAASLFRNDSFTIFAGSEPLENIEETSPIAATSEDSESIAVMDPPVQENQEQETEEFILNLSDAEQESTAIDSEPSTSDADTLELPPLEFGAGSDINLEEVEVEGLGLGLEPMEEELSIPEIDETSPEENTLEIIDEPEVIDLTPPEPIELAPDDESSGSPVEIAIDEEPDVEVLSITLPEEDEATFETNDLSAISLDENTDGENTEIELELNPTQSAETESTSPVLDLGEDEISLELDEDFKIETPAEPPPIPDDILDLNLEIDDTDGPLSTTNLEIPEIEIEDLGLELEDSDPSPDPEKP